MSDGSRTFLREQPSLFTRFKLYVPPAFRNDNLDNQHDLIRTYPLGLVVTSGPAGLMANPIPCVLYADGKFGTLRLHMSRASQQIGEMRAVDECLVVFQGPQSYISPSWYPSKQKTQKVVPTWNYVTVHAWGQPQVFEEAVWLRRQIDDLTHFNERPGPRPWRVADAPDAFISAQLGGIVGVEIPISRIEGKWKLSQNRSDEDRSGVVAGLLAEGAESAALAELVRQRTGES